MPPGPQEAGPLRDVGERSGPAVAAEPEAARVPRPVLHRQLRLGDVRRRPRPGPRSAGLSPGGAQDASQVQPVPPPGLAVVREAAALLAEEAAGDGRGWFSGPPVVAERPHARLRRHLLRARRRAEQGDASDRSGSASVVVVVVVAGGGGGPLLSLLLFGRSRQGGVQGREHRGRGQAVPPEPDPGDRQAVAGGPFALKGVASEETDDRPLLSWRVSKRSAAAL